MATLPPPNYAEFELAPSAARSGTGNSGTPIDGVAAFNRLRVYIEVTASGGGGTVFLDDSPDGVTWVPAATLWNGQGTGVFVTDVGSNQFGNFLRVSWFSLAGQTFSVHAGARSSTI